jgi:hypothetical protein
MFQYGQGVQPDDGRALRWYKFSADRGNARGQNNLEAFTSDIQDDGGRWQNATLPIHDAAFDQAQRWVDIQNLRSRIDKVETDALYQDDLVSQLEHMDKGKKNGVNKIFTVIGTVGAAKYKVLAAKDRAEAAQLRDQLARIENQPQPSVAGRTP